MKKLRYILLYITALLSFTGCEEYLDKAPESTLTIEEIFKDFVHAQGFVEELYAYVVDYAEGGHWETDYLLGDDAICNEVWLGSGSISSVWSTTEVSRTLPRMIPQPTAPATIVRLTDGVSMTVP
jgi:hypothetical protein